MGILRGKRAVIIGASGGIGLACADEFLQEGAKVTGTFRKGKDKMDELAAKYPDFISLPLDISDRENLTAGISDAVHRMGGIDVLVHAAGISPSAILAAVDFREWKETMACNLDSAFTAMQAVILPMMRSGGGSIVMISSVFGERGGVGQSAYCASKAGVLGLTRSAAVELAAKKIRVNAVAPGFIDTPMTAGLGEKLKQRAIEKIPMHRFGLPEEVASMCVFLACDKASYITGQVFTVDGGMSA